MLGSLIKVECPSRFKSFILFYYDAGPWPEVQAFWHFMAFYGILWHFGIFAKKSIKKSNPIFPILSDFFRFLDFSRLLDFPIPQL